MIAAPMTKREAIKRLENLALETGHKRNYYVKKALLEFLDRKHHSFGGDTRTLANGSQSLYEISPRLNRFPN
jgi:predicted transcriptional regulator